MKSRYRVWSEASAETAPDGPSPNIPDPAIMSRRGWASSHREPHQPVIEGGVGTDRGGQVPRVERAVSHPEADEDRSGESRRRGGRRSRSTHRARRTRRPSRRPTPRNVVIGSLLGPRRSSFRPAITSSRGIPASTWIDIRVPSRTWLTSSCTFQSGHGVGSVHLLVADLLQAFLELVVGSVQGFEGIHARSNVSFRNGSQRAVNGRTETGSVPIADGARRYSLRASDGLACHRLLSGSPSCRGAHTAAHAPPLGAARCSVAGGGDRGQPGASATVDGVDRRSNPSPTRNGSTSSVGATASGSEGATPCTGPSPATRWSAPAGSIVASVRTGSRSATGFTSTTSAGAMQPS